MNPAFEKVLRDINRIRASKKDNNTNDVKKDNFKSIKKNKSIDNFMKFQWSWTM